MALPLPRPRTGGLGLLIYSICGGPRISMCRTSMLLMIEA